MTGRFDADPFILGAAVADDILGLVILAVVFSKTNELGGWDRPQLLAVMGDVPAAERTARFATVASRGGRAIGVRCDVADAVGERSQRELCQQLQ